MAPLMHAAETSALPLFPLHNVLLPGAAMGLRVFERRYLDLVRESGRNGTSFGVCLILTAPRSARRPCRLPSVPKCVLKISMSGPTVCWYCACAVHGASMCSARASATMVWWLAR